MPELKPDRVDDRSLARQGQKSVDAGGLGDEKEHDDPAKNIQGKEARLDVRPAVQDVVYHPSGQFIDLRSQGQELGAIMVGGPAWSSP